MSILVNKKSKVIVQGITGGNGSYHTARMVDYGTNIVGGVTPGKGGQDFEGVPVFNLVSDAVQETGADTALIFISFRRRSAVTWANLSRALVCSRVAWLWASWALSSERLATS